MRRLVTVVAAFFAVGMPAATGATATAAASGAPQVSYVTMYSDSGDYVGQGQPRLYTTTEGDSVTLATLGGGTAGYVRVTVSGGAQGDYFTMDFAAAPGQSLHPGLYLDAQRAAFRTAGHPGIDIAGDGRGCNTISGRFDVKSIVLSGDQVVSLWLTYEQHCEEGPTALFGEVRINAVPQSSLQPMSQAVWWPDVALGGGGQTIPAAFVATGTSPVTISSVALGGQGTNEFQIKEDDCTNAVLAPGDMCDVWVRFVPLVKGPQLANLRLTTSGSVVRKVQLDGFGIGGRTELTMQSDPGDWVGQGGTYDYLPSNATIVASGSHTEVHADVNPYTGWSLDFVAPANEILTVGTTYDAARYPFQGNSAGMDITGNGHGCNTVTGTFTVNALSFASDGSLQTANISFVQHCEGGTPALHGTLYWRDPTGDNTPTSRVSHLTLMRTSGGTKVTVSWRNPSDADWSYTIVRRLTGTQPPGSPNGSVYTFAGRGKTVTFSAAHTRVSVAVYAVDSSGNVSLVRTATLPPS